MNMSNKTVYLKIFKKCLRRGFNGDSMLKSFPPDISIQTFENGQYLT